MIDRPKPIRVWGRRRLLCLARLLPLAEKVDIYLLGTGLPSFWVVQLGAMRLTLGLSGWTTNDWSAGSAVQMLMPRENPEPVQVASVAQALSNIRSADLATVASSATLTLSLTSAALNELALRGQVIYDLDSDRYRWRSILPLPLSDKEIGPPHPEMQASENLISAGKAVIHNAFAGPRGGLILTGKVDTNLCEVLINGDDVIQRGKCRCGWHHRYGIRNGPCRHIQALRTLHRMPQKTGS